MYDIDLQPVSSLQMKVLRYVIALVVFGQLTAAGFFFNRSDKLIANGMEKAAAVGSSNFIADIQTKFSSFKTEAERKSFLDLYAELIGIDFFPQFRGQMGDLEAVSYCDAEGTFIAGDYSGKKIEPALQPLLRAHSLRSAVLDRRFVVFVPVVTDGVFYGGLVAQYSNTVIVKERKRLMLFTLLSSAIFIVLASVGGFFISSAITEPVKRLLAGVMQVRGGKMDVEIDVTECDEIGNLARAFNKMIKNLRETTTSVDTLNIEIADRVKAQEELQQLLSLHEATLEATEDGIIVVDVDGKIVVFNQHFLQILQITGKNMKEENESTLMSYIKDRVVDPNGFEARMHMFHSSSGDSTFDVLQFKDGRMLERASHPQRLGEKIVGRVWSYHDVSRRYRDEESLKKASQDLRFAQLQLEQSEKMAAVGQMAAGVAHEINNPLGFVKSNLATFEKYLTKIDAFYVDLKAGATVETAAQKNKIEFIFGAAPSVLADMNDGIERIRKIVFDLKVFSRTDSAETESVDLAAAVESALTLVRGEIKYKAEVVKEFSQVSCVLGSTSKIVQVFVNIMVNAAHAIAEKGTILIRLYQDGNVVCAEIIDSGCGMDSDTMKKIFDPFFTTKPVGIGTGLGLSVSREIVRKFNGDIRVGSELGKGTTFTISFPAMM